MVKVFFPNDWFSNSGNISLSKYPLPGIIDWAMTL